MMESQLVMHQEDFESLLALIRQLVREANAKSVFVVDKAGQLVGEAGETRFIDTTSLASLAAGCVAATGGLAQVIGEEAFPTHFHQGRRDNLHITLVGDRMILVVVFDERSSLGLVRLRVKKATKELARVLEEARKRAEVESGSFGSVFAEITEDDIDRLFDD
jgi:predicted regulator of Ras-like GTPase activity (Roadblock/LC7/MglB family)